MLEWLLKYPLEWYASGDLGITWPWQVYVLGLASLAALLLWLSGYRRLRHGTASFLLRTALLATLLLALARPSLVVEVPEPIRGHIAVLLDDSLSMRIPDSDGITASERMDALLEDGPGSLHRTLETRFDTRRFRFGEDVRPLVDGEPMRYADARSDLGAALLRAADGHDAVSLAGVVVVSDGGGTPPPAERGRLERALLDLRAAGVPAHVVALNGHGRDPDIELRALRMPRRTLVRDRIDVELEIAWQGLGDRRVALLIEDDGIIVDRHELVLPQERGQLLVRRRLGFEEAGRRLLTARIEALPDEPLTENNRRERSIDVVPDPLRVLHFEGEPRFEIKFTRRAVAGDPAIRLTSLVRTADNKYYRLGIEDPSELAGGFPENPAELFRYHVLVLGSVEAGLLTEAQQAAIRDFVARRGGGLLLLGGSGAFAEGGHAGSVLAELMPVVLDEGAGAFRTEVRARPTAAGRGDPLLDLDGTQAREGLFERLPPLTVINPHRRAKPGSTVLLEGEGDGGERLIVLAAQSYGRGRVISFPVRNSWRWQMGVDDPLQDETHETLWRQMLRDLGREAGDRVRVMPPPESIPDYPVTVRALALDPSYRPQPRGALTLAVTTPSGEIRRYPMAPGEDGRGRYNAQFVPRMAGRHDLVVELAENGEVVASAREHVDVTTSGGEFHGQQAGRRLLERVAAETGGRLIEPAQAGQLAALVDDARGSRSAVRRLPLWDAPALLLVVLLLAGADWALRRRRNLA